MAEFVSESVREGLETHHSFIDHNREAISGGESLVLEVLDLEQCGRKVIRAMIAMERPAGEGWQDLWIKNSEDKIEPRTLAIKILEDLDDEEIFRVKRPGRDDAVSGSLYGSFFTTKKMEQESVEFKKQFGRKKLASVKSKDE